jgi:hypothetical protein
MERRTRAREAKNAKREVTNESKSDASKERAIENHSKLYNVQIASRRLVLPSLICINTIILGKSVPITRIPRDMAAFQI